jgi:hypothetical protein
MQHGIWKKVRAAQPHTPFGSKLCLNVDLEDPNNPLEYSKLLITYDLAKLTGRDRYYYTQQMRPPLESCITVFFWKNFFITFAFCLLL